MPNLNNEFANYVKQKNIVNYFNSEQDFLSLFPEEDFDFSDSKYTKFLYFDKAEAKEYLLDFLFFIKQNYNDEVFLFPNFVSIFNIFEKYLDKKLVFFYKKTKMGVEFNSIDGLFGRLSKFFGKEYFATGNNKIAFNNSILSKKTKYTYEFFNYLTEKFCGYNNYNGYIVEPLVKDDINKMASYFKGVPYVENLPFYFSNHNFKDIKNVVRDKIVASSPNMVFAISKGETIVALVVVNIEKTVANLDIICDGDFYDTEINDSIIFICYHLFSKHNIDKITTINENKGLAFSCINSALTVARFKPEYSSETVSIGYSKIKYVLKNEDLDKSSVKQINSIIKFNY